MGTAPEHHDPTGTQSDTGRNRWGWLGRADPGYARRAFHLSLAFVVLAAISTITNALAEQPPAPVELIAAMMVAFGLGELSGRPGHVAVSRLVGLAIFVGFWVVFALRWS